jgi:threonine/homoserine/homoserine lactone efflux protein
METATVTTPRPSSRKAIHKIVLSGLGFGMVIQLAVGPVCLYVFQGGTDRGFWYAERIVFAVALVDALYIAAALAGISVLLRGRRTGMVLGALGSLVVFIFGLDIIASALFAMNIIPAMGAPGGALTGSPFYNGLIITVSNPLTILFWSGVFSSRVSQGGYSRSETVYFSTGCVLATLLFLTFVALASGMLPSFLPAPVIAYFNVAAGLFLVYFAVRMTIAMYTGAH